MGIRLPGKRSTLMTIILIAYCLSRSAKDNPGELRLMIDLDKDKNIPTREGRSNVHKLVIRRTGYVNLAALQAYLNGTMTFDNSVLEAISKYQCQKSRKLWY